MFVVAGVYCRSVSGDYRVDWFTSVPKYQLIESGTQLRDYCEDVLRTAPSIGFDTEFVAEDTFQPQICLIQVAAGGQLALIDPLRIDDLEPFWRTLADAPRTIVHACRVELEFSVAAIGRPPGGLVDTQIAAGLAGFAYPAAYAALMEKLLGYKPKKEETRTDWRRRPLSTRQIEYALDDVSHLHAMYDKIDAHLRRLGRTAWLWEEMEEIIRQVEHAVSGERWRRLPGTSGLDPQSLAVVRELFFWREQEARRRNQPPRRVLRDDLIVELARRKTADPGRIRAVRGMNWRGVSIYIGELAQCIERGLALPVEQRPKKAPTQRNQEMSVLGQFLFAALGSVARKAELAPNLVGGPNDIRDLLAARTDPGRAANPPKLARGWRKQFVGDLFDELLSGRRAVRVSDPDSDFPLEFE